MDTALILYVAIFVFAMMFIGLVLTYLEFKRGAPKRQEKGEEELRKSPHSDV